MMKQQHFERYVVGLMFYTTIDGEAEVVLIQKNHPENQSGKLNGPGGKVNQGETYFDAMVREWNEETGTDWGMWNFLCQMPLESGNVAFFVAEAASKIPICQKTDEKPDWYSYKEIITTPSMLCDHLPWILPLGRTIVASGFPPCFVTADFTCNGMQREIWRDSEPHPIPEPPWATKGKKLAIDADSF